MKSKLALQLKAILDGMSQEQFDKEWGNVTSLNLEGPSFDEAIEYFNFAIDEIGRFELNTEIIFDVNLGNNYSDAA